jgi:putative transposase
MARIWGSLNLLVFIKISSIIKPEKILLLKPVNSRGDYHYNRTVRHEWLDQYTIESIEEAQEFATQWLWTYNNERPNMGIGGITPAQKLRMAA